MPLVTVVSPLELLLPRRIVVPEPICESFPAPEMALEAV
jgi:hypothetical protein